MFIYRVRKNSSSRGGGGGGVVSRIGGELIKRASCRANIVSNKQPIPDPSIFTNVFSNNNNNNLARGLPSDGDKINYNNFDWANLGYDQFHDPSVIGSESDESDSWVSVNNDCGVSELESCRNGNGVSMDLLLANPPTLDEVQTAIDSINEAFAPEYDYDSNNQMIASPASSTSSVYSSDSEWKEPSMPVWQPQGCELEEVPDLGMLRDPIVKEMVIGLSTDEKMWECAKQNPVVRKVKEMFSADQSKASTKNFISWFFDNTTGKAIEFFKSLTDFVNKFFKTEPSTERAEANVDFDKILRSSYMLTIVVFIVVVNNRMHNA